MAIARAIVDRSQAAGRRRAHRRPRRARAREILDLLRALNRDFRQDDRHGHPRPARGRAGPHPAPPREGSPAGLTMKFLPYLLKHLRRNWFRTALTVLAMALCIFLFCTLQSVLAQINALLDSRSASRLVTRNSVNFTFPLPLAYGSRIQAVPGVVRVATSNWFGGLLPAKEGAEADLDDRLEQLLPEPGGRPRAVPGHVPRVPGPSRPVPGAPPGPARVRHREEDWPTSSAGRSATRSTSRASSPPTARRTAPSSSSSGPSSTPTP